MYILYPYTQALNPLAVYSKCQWVFTCMWRVVQWYVKLERGLFQVSMTRQMYLYNYDFMQACMHMYSHVIVSIVDCMHACVQFVRTCTSYNAIICGSRHVYTCTASIIIQSKFSVFARLLLSRGSSNSEQSSRTLAYHYDRSSDRPSYR